MPAGDFVCTLGRVTPLLLVGTEQPWAGQGDGDSGLPTPCHSRRRAWLTLGQIITFLSPDLNGQSQMHSTDYSRPARWGWQAAGSTRAAGREELGQGRPGSRDARTALPLIVFEPRAPPCAYHTRGHLAVHLLLTHPQHHHHHACGPSPGRHHVGPVHVSVHAKCVCTCVCVLCECKGFCLGIFFLHWRLNPRVLYQ